MPTVYKKIFTDETEEELMALSREEVTLELNDRQRKFCEVFVKSFNPKIAALQAGYKHTNAHTLGWKLRQDPNVNRYIAWLKVKVARAAHIDAVDIIDQYTRIAFADITDYVDIKNGRISIKDGDLIDGQVVKAVRRGKDGLSVELIDKLSALEKLERYFEIMPKDWKEKIEEKKLEISRERLELERFKAGQIEDEEEESDGFIEALKATAEEVWA